MTSKNCSQPDTNRTRIPTNTVILQDSYCGTISIKKNILDNEMFGLKMREDIIYSYFEKGCWIKCTRQPRNVSWWSWVHCFSTKVTKVGSTATVSGTGYWSYPILSFGIVACTFFPTTFLEIAVWPGGVRTGIGMHCGCRILKMAAKVEKFRRLYALFFDSHFLCWKSSTQFHKHILI